jgi:hypothetical protein
VPAGTYTIAVGSSLAGQGSFDINVTETDAAYPMIFVQMQKLLLPKGLPQEVTYVLGQNLRSVV